MSSLGRAYKGYPVGMEERILRKYHVKFCLEDNEVGSGVGEDS